METYANQEEMTFFVVEEGGLDFQFFRCVYTNKGEPVTSQANVNYTGLIHLNYYFSNERGVGSWCRNQLDISRGNSPRTLCCWPHFPLA